MEVVSSYTRKQALEDGFLADVSEMAREAGVKFPTAVSSAVYAMLEDIPKNMSYQSVSGRLWDLMWQLRCKIAASGGGDLIYFTMIVHLGTSKKKTHEFYAKCHGGDNGEPVITVMLKGED